MAATVAMAGVDNVLGERERIVEVFKSPKLDVIERAREVALAAQHADLLHRAAQDEEATYGDLLPRMTLLRGIFLDDMDLLRKRQPRLVSQKALDEIRRGDQRVQDKANDLNDCVDWYRRNRTAIGRTTVTDEELAEASNLATEALARVGKNLVARTPKEGAGLDGRAAPTGVLAARRGLRHRATVRLVSLLGARRRLGAVRPLALVGPRDGIGREARRAPAEARVSRRASPGRERAKAPSPTVCGHPRTPWGY
jgi:hypothetical protein